MTLLSLLAITVYAAEIIVSPLPDSPPQPNHPSVSFGAYISPLPTNGNVLGLETTAIPTPSPSTTPMPTMTPAPIPLISRKRNVTIAVLGDSMVDTLGPDIPHLKTKLEAAYPATRFTMFNYGVGGTNIGYGIERLTNSYAYLGSQVPSLVSQHPDIVVIESFAYNPFPDADGGIDRHWLSLAKVIDVLKGQLPQTKIVIAATIAPNAKVFGDGAAGISFSTDDKWQRVDVIKKYLESTTRFARSQHLPLADAYHPSLGSDGNGNLAYINAGDHIHYSDAGRALLATVVTNAIVANKLLE